MNNDKVAIAVKSGNGTISSLVRQVTELGMDIKKLQRDRMETEHEIVKALVKERRTDCLSINYGALRRFYHD